VSKTEPFNIPDLRDSTGIRLSERDKQNLRLLMLDRRETVVSNIIKWALEEQASPVRQRWLATAARIAQEEEAADGRP
jgi:hypothetical protein